MSRVKREDDGMEEQFDRLILQSRIRFYWNCMWCVCCDWLIQQIDVARVSNRDAYIPIIMNGTTNDRWMWALAVRNSLASYRIVLWSGNSRIRTYIDFFFRVWAPHQFEFLSCKMFITHIHYSKRQRFKTSFLFHNPHSLGGRKSRFLGIMKISYVEGN